MAVRICRAERSGDFQRFHALLKAYEGGLPADLRHGVVPDVEAVCGAYAGPNAAFLAMDEGDAVGCIAVTQLDASTALMLRLFVKETHRGAGIARDLVSVALEFLREHRFARVVLDTDKQRLSAAYQLYQSLGFHECEPYGAVDYESPTYMELML